MKPVRLIPLIAAGLFTGSAALADTFCNQTPPNGGGTMRWSTLWQDPNGDNDSDSDAICYEDFVLANPVSINHLEWWGSGPCELGFQIEFWKQDPGTIAYQPYAVFRDVGAQPEQAYVVTNPTTTSEYGITKYSVYLPTPTNLAANNSSNPRWFIAIIALTSAYYDWSWARGLGGSTRTFWWYRADGNSFHLLGEGRAMRIMGNYTTAWLTGTVDLQGLAVSPAGRSATLEFRAPGTTTVVHSYPITLTSTGAYNAGTVAAGTYDVAVKFSHWLRAKTPSTVIANGPNTVNLSLPNGDATDDNSVDLFDLNQVFVAFAGPDAMADYDGNGIVDLFDMNINLSNFGMAGDN